MEQLRTATAGLVCVVAILSLLALLAMSSFMHDRAVKPQMCDYLQLSSSVRHSASTDADKIPTLAPPRADVFSKADKPSHTLSLGQAVYVQVKTDYPEIEVGWAPGELLGR